MKKMLIGASMMTLVTGGLARAEWYDTMKVKGDVRVRYERIDQEDKDVRDRERIRARFGVFPKINNDVDAGIQFASGPKDEPTSRNATLTGGFQSKDVGIDLAYVDWHPQQLKGLDLFAGKFQNPFICVSDYIWDGDLTPEGVALKYHAGDDIELLANAGYLWITERSADNDDTTLAGGQIALAFHASEDVTFTAGASCYAYDKMDGYELVDPSGKMSSFGNSKEEVVQDGKTNFLYAVDYMMIEPFAQVQFNVGLPVTVFASYVSNREADGDDTGYAAGVKVGKASDPNTFELGYDFRYLEKDATAGAFTDSDSWGGGTDGQGHRLSAKYQIAKNWQGGVTYLIDQKGLDDAKSVDYSRLQVDLVAKF